MPSIVGGSTLARRDLLLAGAWLTAGSRAAWATDPTSRIVALDWAAGETVVALGHKLTGVAELRGFAQAADLDVRPPDVIDVGLRLEPNQELMQELRPDLILINSAQQSQLNVLKGFGSVEEFAVYGTPDGPFERARVATRDLAERLGLEEAGTRFLQEVDTTMASCRERLGESTMPPLYVVNPVGAQQVLIFGTKSLFQGVLDRLGLVNAWSGRAGIWGTAVVGLETLAAREDACIVYFGPFSADGRRLLEGTFWSHLPAVRAGRVAELPPLWAFGALPSAMRVARALSQRLGQRDH